MIVALLGMHRSGTSAAGALLESIGVDMGHHARHLPPLDENPRGFWEHAGIRDINEELLLRLGGSWHTPPPLARGWHQLATLDDLRQRAADLVRTDFDGRSLWGWKDPRACLLLPFWIDLLPPMRYVVCVRNPADVAQSLEQRDGLTRDHALRLWLVSMAGALLHTAGQRRCLLHYEAMVDAPHEAAAQMSRLIDADEVVPRVQGRVEARLQHHRTPLTQTLADESLPRAVRDLYRVLCDAQAPASALDTAAQDTLRALADADRAHSLDTWFTRYVASLNQAVETDPELGRPRPVGAARTRAREYLASHPPLGIAYRRVRRAVRTLFKLGP